MRSPASSDVYKNATALKYASPLVSTPLHRLHRPYYPSLHPCAWVRAMIPPPLYKYIFLFSRHPPRALPPFKGRRRRRFLGTCPHKNMSSADVPKYSPQDMWRLEDRLDNHDSLASPLAEAHEEPQAGFQDFAGRVDRDADGGERTRRDSLTGIPRP